MWGLFAAYWAAFPGPSGEWAALAVPASYLVDIPVGLVALVLGLLSDQRSPHLRRLTVIAGILALAMPFVVALAWRLHNGRW